MTCASTVQLKVAWHSIHSSRWSALRILPSRLLLITRACQIPNELCFPVAGLQAPAKFFPSFTVMSNDAAVPAEPEIPWRASHPSTIQAQCCLT